MPDQATAYSGPLPKPTPETKPFWDGVNQGKLMLQRCAACGPYFYPRPFCPSCFSWDVEWFEAGGNGKVYSFVISHRKLPYMNGEPYVIAIIELDEGPRMMSNLIGVDPRPRQDRLRHAGARRVRRGDRRGHPAQVPSRLVRPGLPHSREEEPVMPTKDLRGKVAIVGACETDRLGTLPDHSMITLHAEGIRNALDDAGPEAERRGRPALSRHPHDPAGRVPGDHAPPLQQHPDGGLLLHRHGRARHAGPRRGPHQRRRHLPRRKRPLPHRRRPPCRRPQPPRRPVRGPLRHPWRTHNVLLTGHAPHARVRHHAWNKWRKCQSRPGSGPKCTPKP